MGAESKIQWTDHTFNPWWGCTRVSPGCQHCYAETFAKRTGLAWGVGADRRFFKDKHWNEPRKWNEAAEKAGVRARVFCASMADAFEDRRELDEPRARLFALIAETPHLDWLLLTKRPENMARLAPTAWAAAWPANVWAGCTVEDQRRADERILCLLAVPAAVRFLSCEPLLGAVDLDMGRCETHNRAHVANDAETNEEFCNECAASGYSGELSFGHWLGDVEDGLHWVIVGGESGPGARPFDLAWARSLVAQCKAAGVPVFVKQMGAAPKTALSPAAPGQSLADRYVEAHNAAVDERQLLRLKSRKGDDMAEWPEDLRVREWPEVSRG